MQIDWKKELQSPNQRDFGKSYPRNSHVSPQEFDLHRHDSFANPHKRENAREYIGLLDG